MPEILFISGKGGTGKTSLTAAFAHLAAHSIICDLDVDAPDLHLLLRPNPQLIHDFYSGHEASIQPDLCDGCGTCRHMCRFDAIAAQSSAFTVDSLKCEGCKVCVTFCPSDAIAFTSKHCGTWYTSDTRFGPMLHAQLFPGEENSGRLVALLRQKAREIAKAQDLSLIISDGPPGIGCPVISAVSGVDLAVIVTESTPSGLHDMERIISLCRHFNIPVAVMINKCDLNRRMTAAIETYCRQHDYPVVAKLPHDPLFVHAMVQGATVTEYSDGKLVQKLKECWDYLFALTLAQWGAKKKTTFRLNDNMIERREKQYHG